MSRGDLVELKFRLFDGSDIGPFQYPPTAKVSVLKERIVSEWPAGKTVVPNSPKEIKVINNGRVLDNSKTVAQCKSPFDDDDIDSVITMHVVVQQSGSKAKPDKRTRQQEAPTNCVCCCTIM